MQVSSSPRWGVLVYSSASPDIEPACRASFEEVVRAHPADGVSVAGWLGTTGSVRQTSPQGDNVRPPVDMSRPEALESFLRWGMKAVPAERYVIVLGGHGSGFMGAVMDSRRQRIMAPQEMREALERSGMKADVLVLNACLEANVEVAAELAPRASMLVASQGLQKGLGLPLGQVVEGLRADMRPVEAARLVVDASAGVPARSPVVSAVDEAQVASVMRALDRLGASLLDDSVALSAAREIAAALPDFRELPRDRPLVDLKDIRTLAQRLATDARLRSTATAEAAAALDAAADQAVVARTQGDGSARDAWGLSAYLPTKPLPYDWVNRQYDRLTLSAQAPHWHAAMASLSGA
ncbi:MAG: hypothetical protein EB084_24710 [Proteobacteria bacterium]|nr:hypothetical protein [Pseudomonadota bacterium]